MNPQFLLLLSHELSVNWYFNTSLAFKGLSNKDIRTAVYSMSGFLGICTRTTVLLHRRLLLDQHSCHSKHPLSFGGAEMFRTSLLTKSFLFEWIAEVELQPVHACKTRIYGLMLAGISESEELISKVALDFSEVNVMFAMALFQWYKCKRATSVMPATTLNLLPVSATCSAHRAICVYIDVNYFVST